MPAANRLTFLSACFVVSNASEGKLGAIFDGVEVFAEPGDLILEPRGEWHTFWNPSDKPTRVLELITPGGLEDFFRKIDLGVTDEELDRLAAAAQCDVDMAQTGPLLEKYGLTFGGEIAP
ncbi:cupin domain-containing protein [Antrihabitans sp. YC3-6]|uniref:Cupin domain-containing protein n=1 Tax=Antrihabitans stalagmiti TaxID=2799499 RepID=A0A934U6M4_9NOCA|nr:cupin domain-containing protein [Antrihabitans stalagmiti]MBJ8342676.1 cupin domain-containing protein [Antrihabitans stalagmiti]